MKGNKEKSFWTTFAIMMVLLLGGAGYYLFTSFSSYSSSAKDFESNSQILARLERAPLYPNEDNIEMLKAKIKGFEDKVDGLHGQLKAYQKPLVQISDQQFPNILSSAINKFKDYRMVQDKPNGKLKFLIPDEFSYGMDKYLASPPPSRATGILNYQLEAIDYLLRIIASCETDEFYALKRYPTPLETGGEDPEKSNWVVKYPMSVSFRTTHDGLRKFVNTVANDKEYFYSIRLIRIDNEQKQGPKKINDQGNVTRNADGEVVESLPVDENGEIIDTGESYTVEDARIIFGNERLQVTAMIDICRFPERIGEDGETSESR